MGTKCTHGRLVAVVCSVALVVAAARPPAGIAAESGDAAGRLDLVSARLGQSGPDLVLRLRTHGRWRVRALGSGRAICLGTLQGSRQPRSACLTASPRGHPALVLTVAPGSARAKRKRLPGRARRTGDRDVTIRSASAAAGMRKGVVAWGAVARWSGRRCVAGALPCRDVIPNTGLATLRLRRPILRGCRHHGAAFRTHGSASRRWVALTFDDGPSGYTGAILRELRRQHARATFFVLGSQARGRGSLLRRMLREGSEIASHGWSHRGTSAWELQTTNAIVRRATGFRPCLYRAPSGAFTRSGIALAHRLGLTSVMWNVDPRDWQLPGSGAVTSRVLQALRPGSIVVMHDGAAFRGQAAAALPAILRGLRRRGYRAVTVTELLGGRWIRTPSQPLPERRR